MENDRNVTSTITANAGSVVIPTWGASTVGVDVSNTWVGTLSFKGTIDGTNYFSVSAAPFGAAAAAVQSTTANGRWSVDVAGLTAFEVVATAWTSGTATVVLEASVASSSLGDAALEAIAASVNPVASVMADAESNATAVSRIGVRNELWNRGTWDRQVSGQTGDQTSVVGFANNLIHAIYQASQGAIADGHWTNLQCDVNGNLRAVLMTQDVAVNNTDGVYAYAFKPLSTNTYAPAIVVSSALGKSLVVKASAGNLFAFIARLDSTATTSTAFYVQLHNATSLPANTAVPVCTFKLAMPSSAADQIRSIAIPSGMAQYFSTGIVIALSTTEFTLTLVGSNWLSVEHSVSQ